MTPLAQDLFVQAHELEPAARDAFLAEACGDDAELRLEVQRMLVDAARADSFFGDDDGATLGADEFKDTYAEKEGDVIGPYKLRQQIGEGGFGTVWMAEQSVPISRMVALKVIKAGMDTKQVLARFEAERQAVAMMDHPHIAKILDAGATPTGRPYFAMELVKGIPITDYCDQAGLGTKERLALFRDVCSAINHAHQKGIIHRDIKPSNVMVTLHGDKPVVKVIDFGIAKATQGKLTDQTLFTRFEQFIGTPVYMSPEQASLSGLDIDTRSDIYALGILLYELLVGKPPFDPKSLVSAGYEEMRRIIREVEPVKPSSRLGTIVGEERTLLAKAHRIEEGKLGKLVEPDLDWIVMKAIDKDRTRRYETANAFAQDIVRFLSDEPVTATPPSAGYQFRKFARRHKAAFRLAALIALLLIAATLVSGWQAVRATRAEKVATNEATRATAAFDELRATAPAFAEQARGLAAKEQYADAIAKLDYAIKLRPDAAEFLMAKGDLLQCQLQLAPAAAIYRDALRVQPGHARAGASAKLCEELLAAPPAADGKLTRESLAKLHLAMQRQQRPAAELLPVARLLGEEKKLIVEYWLARLKDLPVSAENPLAKRLTVREDGRLALDLSGTKITDLSPLAGAPLAVLNLTGSTELTDLSPLAGLALLGLDLSRTRVTDLTPLREMHSLETLTAYETQVADLAPLSALRLKGLYLRGSSVTDLTPLQKMPLEKLHLGDTRVTDLSPLIGMPIKSLWLDQTPVRDFSPLAQMPLLEGCYLTYTLITDLSVLRGRPLKELTLTGCEHTRHYAVLTEIPTLKMLLLPEAFRTLPDEDLAAIGALRTHPKLRQIQAEFEGTKYYSHIQSTDLFWQDWDRLQTFLPALRKSGFRFTLRKEPDGTYLLSIENQSLSDLTILKGAAISHLRLINCKVTDLTPLRDLPLKRLWLNLNPITDLSPLRGMQVQELVLSHTHVSDVSPLAGMPLKSLFLHDCRKLRDISPLLEVPTLEELIVPKEARNLELLRKMPNLKNMDYNNAPNTNWAVGSTVADFWKKWEALTWMHALNAAGIPYVANEIIEQVPEVNIWKRSGMWAVKIASKDFRDCSIFKGADDIRDLNLVGSAVTDLAPLADCKGLQSLILPPDVKDIEFLRASTQLNRISYREGIEIFQPAQTAKEFWKEYDSLGWLRALNDTGVQYTAIEITEEPPEAATPSGKGKKKKAAAKSAAKGTGLWAVTITSKDFSDCSIFKGADNIRNLNLTGSAMTDLAPLADCKELKSLILPPNAKDIEFLRTFPKLERLGFGYDPKTFIPDKTAAEFWKEYDSQDWLKALRASGLAIQSVKQLEDGTWDLDLTGAAITDLTILKGAPISRLKLTKTAVSDLTALRECPLRHLSINGTRVADLAPLRGLPLQTLAANGTAVADLEPLRGMALKELALHGTKVTDLRPLQGMPLETLNLKATKVTDLSSLRGMPLTKVEFLNCPDLTDLSPLAETKGLTLLILPPNAKGIEFLRTFPKLAHIGFKEHPTSGFLPDKTAAEFWKEWDAGKK